ncbi:MAG: transposase, partial [Geminicoccaceae bacterium]
MLGQGLHWRYPFDSIEETGRMPCHAAPPDWSGDDVREKRSSLDELAGLIDWAPIERRLEVIHAAPWGEASWPPLAMFRGMLLAVWHDLSDIKLADALDDRASFRRFCGFSRTEPTPERTAFVRFRRELLCHGLDQV